MQDQLQDLKIKDMDTIPQANTQEVLRENRLLRERIQALESMVNSLDGMITNLIQGMQCLLKAIRPK